MNSQDQTSLTPLPLVPGYKLDDIGFDAIREAHSSSLDEWLSLHSHLPADSLLWHYTSAEGMLGILESRKLWFSNARFLNDTEEIKHGYELVTSLTLERATEYGEDHPTRQMLQDALYEIPHLRAGSGGRLEYFVCCFCENGNLLSQWRSYGNKDGYCLGVAVSDHLRIQVDSGPKELDSYDASAGLSDGFYNPGGRVVLRKVIYDVTEQRSLVSDVLDRYCDALDEIKSSEGVIPARSAANASYFVLAIMLTEFAIAFKNPAFSVEEEWRMISLCNLATINPEHLAFRISFGLPVPYIKFNFFEIESLRHWLEFQEDAGAPKSWPPGSFPLEKIIVGPRPQSNRAIEAVKIMLSNLGYHYGARVEAAEIPVAFG